MISRIALLASCCLLLVSGHVGADDCVPVVRDGWVRLPPAQMPMAAGFARIDNACPAAMVVVGARSPAFASAELHETRVVDGVSRMRHVPELRIEARGEALLVPGGLHLMLMRPVSPLVEGGTVEVELELADGRRVPAMFAVRRPDAL